MLKKLIVIINNHHTQHVAEVFMRGIQIGTIDSAKTFDWGLQDGKIEILSDIPYIEDYIETDLGSWGYEVASISDVAVTPPQIGA